MSSYELRSLLGPHQAPHLQPQIEEKKSLKERLFSIRKNSESKSVSPPVPFPTSYGSLSQSFGQKPQRAKQKEKRHAAPGSTSALGDIQNVSAYCVAKSLDFKKLRTYWEPFVREFQLRSPSCLMQSLQSQPLQMFVLGRMSSQDHFLEQLEKFTIQPLDEVESDDFVFSVDAPRRSVAVEDVEDLVRTPSKSSLKIVHDHIILQSEDVFVKLAASFAIAQSTKLSTFEADVEILVEENKEHPHVLAAHGRIGKSAIEISKTMGKLFVHMNDVNLYSDVLDVPDFFWDYDVVLAEYKTVRAYLDVKQRVAVLNQRLGVLQELLDMLRLEQSTRHGTKLEWLIIVLLIVEAFLEVVPVIVLLVQLFTSCSLD